MNLFVIILGVIISIIGLIRLFFVKKRRKNRTYVWIGQGENPLKGIIKD
jgi:glucose uptake protein GlcU